MRHAWSRRLLGVVLGSAVLVWSAAVLAQQKPVTLEYFSWSIFCALAEVETAFETSGLHVAVIKPEFNKFDTLTK